ncbi:START domain-containing protein 10 isoform X2 [Girardinichthys multiradiatus]|uniref:START domain-containing protein 10 isoform X2 n=1 Tax=Girardinichthys multiradiatus TaxID=208333 RepID=UPI001FACBA2B|nr:START domain-containing protein 10 isoform X2 [Girardinichthys multiradiatus]
MPVRIPDDSDFSSFKDQCLSTDGWNSRYNKSGVTVWCREEDSSSVQKIKMRIMCKDVMAETLYDVLHDTSYRKCPTPLKDRDFVTMRSWLPLGNDYMIINYSVKHPQHPPKKDYVRAVSLLTGYLIQSNSSTSSTLYYLTQVDPRGSLPKWVVNRVSQFVAPKAMRKIYKASLKYPEWKRKHNPTLKPWMYPEQNTLPSVSLADLTLQRADSLENIDESGVREEKAQHSDDEET